MPPMDQAEFERWETRFKEPEYQFGTEPNAFLAAQKALLPKAGRALAVADGEGRNGVWLAERGLDVLSLDFSPSAQAKAQALARSRGVSLTTELADVTRWSWPANAFDVIAVILTQFTGPAERARMFDGIRQALKPGGLLLLHGYTPKQLEYGTGGPSKVENLYTRDLLEGAFGDFTDLRITDYEKDVSEGKRHNGMSAMIDLVGRK
jgi:cyclopropane fatty-acyl-phospholipid synthase-like methyltransferase